MRWTVLACCVAGVIGCGSKLTGPKEAAEMQPATSVGAYQLFQAYEDNVAAADSKYLNQRLELGGGRTPKVLKDDLGYYLGFVLVDSIGNVSPARFNRMSPQEKKWFTEGYPPNVICRLAAGEEAKAAKLQGSVAVRGTCVGRKSAEVWMGYVVILKDCRIVESDLQSLQARFRQLKPALTIESAERSKIQGYEGKVVEIAGKMLSKNPPFFIGSDNGSIECFFAPADSIALTASLQLQRGEMKVRVRGIVKSRGRNGQDLYLTDCGIVAVSGQ